MTILISVAFALVAVVLWMAGYLAPALIVALVGGIVAIRLANRTRRRDR